MLTLLAFGVIAYALVLAESAEPGGRGYEDVREQVLWAMLVAAPFCVALSAGAAWWLSGRALTPLDVVIRETQAIHTADLHRRLQVPARDDELRDLTVGLNGLLARLEEGFQALSEYAASASHELRTPLAVAVSELEVALRHPRSAEEWARVATTSLDELRRLPHLVEALLTLSRDDTTSLGPSTFDLQGSLERALASNEPEARAAGVHLTASGHAPGLVTAHEALLTGALEELLRNGIRYTPCGGSVIVRLDATGNDGVDVHVDDTGPGIDPAERDAIFAPFHRGTRGRATSPQGFGLGLTFARRSVERSGGRLVVGSSPEGGGALLDEPEARALGEVNVLGFSLSRWRRRRLLPCRRRY